MSEEGLLLKQQEIIDCLTAYCRQLVLELSQYRSVEKEEEKLAELTERTGH